MGFEAERLVSKIHPFKVHTFFPAEMFYMQVT